MTSRKPEDLVIGFFAQLAQGRVEAALSDVDENIVYTNVGLPTVRGMKRFGALMRRLNGGGFVGFDAQLLAIAADDDGVVLTERIDLLRLGPLRLRFWVCGRNEVRDGRIVLWRDYFDFFDFTKAVVRGLIALPVPGIVKPLADPVSHRAVGVGDDA